MLKTIGKGLRDPRRAGAVACHRLLSVAGTTRYRRFIVLSRSRTGSNLLLTLLRSHPRIWADGEVFHRLEGRDARTLLAKTFGKQPFYIKARGFKIFYYHPLDDGSSPIWDELRSLADLHVLHLKRRNILRTLVSWKVAETRGVWTAGAKKRDAPTTEPVRVTFSVDELAAGFEQTRAWEESGDSGFRGHPLLVVYYEDLLRDRDGEFRRITDFLGVPYVQPKTGLVRQGRDDLRNTLVDYDALKSAFTGTEWEQFFEE